MVSYDIFLFADGSDKTVVVSGFQEQTSASDPRSKGGDYLVWAGNPENKPVSVSVTAVRAGAMGGSSFGGASFGAGKGVTKTFD